MTNVIAIGLTVVAIGITYGLTVAWRRSRRRREAECAAVSAAVHSIAEAVQRPPNEAPTQPLMSAALLLTVEENGGEQLGTGLRQMIPMPACADPDAGLEAQLKPIQDVFERLDRNTVVVAGVEQTFLGLVAATTIDPVKMSVALQQFAQVPDELHQAAADLAGYVHGPDFTADVSNALHETVSHAAHNLIGGLVESAHDAAARVVFEGGRLTALAIAKDFVASEAMHGLTTFLHSAQHAEGVVQATQHLEHAAHGVGDLFDVHDAVGHFPVATAILAGIREIRLYNSGKTTGEVAIKNLSLDVAGAGTGGFAGGKAGAIIGSMIAPGPGTVIGGLLGAAFGAMGGKALTNKVKTKKYREAVSSFEFLRQARPEKIRVASAQLSSTVVGVVQRSRCEYQAAIGRHPSVMGDHGDEIRMIGDGLRAATYEHLAHLWQLVIRASQLAAQGRISCPDLDRVEQVLAAGDEALRRYDEYVTQGALLHALCVLASVPIPVPTDGCVSSRDYISVCRSLGEELRRLGAEYHDEIGNWTTRATHEFAHHVKGIGALVEPHVRGFKTYQETCHQELERAASVVRLEAERLGH